MMGALRALAPVVAVALLAGPTLAQPNKEPSAKDKEIAGDLVKKAIAKSQAGEHAAAIDIYLQAYTIVPNSLLLSNIGSEFQQSNKPIEALRYFCMYLEKDPTGTNAPYAQSQAHAIQMQLGNKVDEKNVCAKKPEPKVEPKPIVEPKPVEEPPVKPVEQPAGPVDTGEKSRTSGGTLRWVGVGAGVVGLAAIGGGVFFGIQAQQISDKITNHDKMMAWPDNIQALEKEGQDDENLQIGLLIGGGVAVAAGVVLYVVGGPKPVAEQPSIAVLPTSNGFAVSGRF